MSSCPRLKDLDSRISSPSAVSFFFDLFFLALLSFSLLNTSKPFENEPTIDSTQLATFECAISPVQARASGARDRARYQEKGRISEAHQGQVII